MAVGSAECVDILLPTVTGINQVFTPPGKACLPKQMNQQYISHQPRMSSVAVGKWVNCGKSVMKTYRNLIRRIAAVFDPGSAIGAEILQIALYLPCCDTNILAAVAPLSCPAPDMTKHPFVRSLDKANRKNIFRLAPKCPRFRFADIFLFKAIKLAPTGDMGKKQPLRFIGVKWCRPVRIVEDMESVPKDLSESLSPAHQQQLQ